MAMLGRSQVSGTFKISATAPGTVVCRIPPQAEEPAQVSLKNGHATAVLYAKWIPYNNTNPSVSTSDAGIRLEPYESYTWDKPPGAAMLLVLSTVDNSSAHVEGAWSMPDQPQLL